MATTTSTTTSPTDSSTSPSNSTLVVRGSIVVVAKCPIPGKSKTRLIPCLGHEGSVVLAKAMLSDVLTTLTECKQLDAVDKILLYAPPTDQGASIMATILHELGISREWTLRPMKTDVNNLMNSHLGSQLTQALIETRSRHVDAASVVFLGMDAPELPLDEIVAALSTSSIDNDNCNTNNNNNYAHLCPAADGGYGMLSVPGHAPADAVFRGVRWSDPLTAVSQIKALTDIDGVNVRMGRWMHDIDEADDVSALCERLRKSDQVHTDASASNDNNDCLRVQSAAAAAVTVGTPQTGSCRYTRQALMQLGKL